MTDEAPSKNRIIPDLLDGLYFAMAANRIARLPPVFLERGDDDAGWDVETCLVGLPTGALLAPGGDSTEEALVAAARDAIDASSAWRCRSVSQREVIEVLRDHADEPLAEQRRHLDAWIAFAIRTLAGHPALHCASNVG